MIHYQQSLKATEATTYPANLWLSVVKVSNAASLISLQRIILQMRL